MVSLKGTSVFAVQLVAVIALLLGWTALAQIVNLPDALPSPLRVADVLFSYIERGLVLDPLMSTLSRTVYGFLLGLALAILYGVLTFASPFFDRFSRPIFVLVLFSPSLVIIFMFLIMFDRSPLAVVLIVAYLTMAEMGTYIREALSRFDHDLVGVADSFCVSKTRRVIDMYIPFLIPALLTASRVGFTLAWKIAFLSEIFGFPNGLGWKIRGDYRTYQIASLLSWLIVFIVVLLLIEQVIRYAERKLVKWPG